MSRKRVHGKFFGRSLCPSKVDKKIALISLKDTRNINCPSCLSFAEAAIAWELDWARFMDQGTIATRFREFFIIGFQLGKNRKKSAN
jgi:hypothetical protein